MNLRRAIQIVRQSAKSNIDDDIVIDAIALAGNYFLRKTKMDDKEFLLELDADEEEFRISHEGGFHPSKLILVATTFFQEVEHSNYRDIASKYAGNPAPAVESSYPRCIGFRNSVSGLVFPRPASDNKTLRITYHAPLVNMEDHDDNKTLNIPDEYLYEVLTYGATAVAEHRVPDALFQNDAWQKFLQLTKEAKEESAVAGTSGSSLMSSSEGAIYPNKEGGVRWH